MVFPEYEPTMSEIKADMSSDDVGVQSPSSTDLESQYMWNASMPLPYASLVLPAQA